MYKTRAGICAVSLLVLLLAVLVLQMPQEDAKEPDTQPNESAPAPALAGSAPGRRPLLPPISLTAERFPLIWGILC